MDKELKTKASMFSGSAPFKYHPSNHLEAGIGLSWFHSIVAMPQYHNVSFEELRMEDYNASGGIFGSKIAKLGATLCDPPGDRPTPHCFGTLFKDAIGSFTDGQDEQPDKPKDEHPGKIPLPSAVPVDPIKTMNPFGINQSPNLNLSFQGMQNVTLIMNSDLNANFSISVTPQKSSEFKSFNFIRNVKDPKGETEKSEKKESDRRHKKH